MSPKRLRRERRVHQKRRRARHACATEPDARARALAVAVAVAVVAVVIVVRVCVCAALFVYIIQMHSTTGPRVCEAAAQGCLRASHTVRVCRPRCECVHKHPREVTTTSTWLAAAVTEITFRACLAAARMLVCIVMICSLLTATGTKCTLYQAAALCISNTV